MKPLIALTLATLVACSPIALLERAQPDAAAAAQLGGGYMTGLVAKEFTMGGCRDVIFIYARGSTEFGNMGSTVGPPLSDGIKARWGDKRVATEGVDYAALLSTNFLPGGADPIGVTNMRTLLADATAKCPNSKIVAGGYSQGAAIAHRSIEALPDVARNRIVAVVTFGDTQSMQDKAQIPKFPQDRIKIICNDGDEVCKGTLNIQPPHLDYVRRVPEGFDFLNQMIGNI